METSKDMFVACTSCDTPMWQTLMPDGSLAWYKLNVVHKRGVQMVVISKKRLHRCGNGSCQAQLSESSVEPCGDRVVVETDKLFQWYKKRSDFELLTGMTEDEWLDAGRSTIDEEIGKYVRKYRLPLPEQLLRQMALTRAEVLVECCEFGRLEKQWEQEEADERERKEAEDREKQWKKDLAMLDRKEKEIARQRAEIMEAMQAASADAEQELTMLEVPDEVAA